MLFSVFYVVFVGDTRRPCRQRCLWPAYGSYAQEADLSVVAAHVLWRDLLLFNLYRQFWRELYRCCRRISTWHASRWDPAPECPE